MKKRIAIIVLLTVTAAVWAKTPKACKNIEAQIEHVDDQLRAGYKEPRGNKLRKYRRKLKEQLSTCKKNN